MNIKLLRYCLFFWVFLYTHNVIFAQSSRTYIYQTDKTYSVPAGLGIATQIVLDPSEKVLDFGTGFSMGWDIVRRDNIFYIKPKDPDAETNMYVRTDRRSYIFELKIVSKDWKKLEEARAQGVVYLVQFNYPDNVAAEKLKAQEDAKRVREMLSRPDPTFNYPSAPSKSPYTSYHTDYEAAAENGSKWLLPSRIYDDGQVTYVVLNTKSNTPSFFGRQYESSEEYALNSSKKNNTHILHGVFPFILLRHGSDVVMIRRK